MINQSPLLLKFHKRWGIAATSDSPPCHASVNISRSLRFTNRSAIFLCQ